MSEGFYPQYPDPNNPTTPTSGIVPEQNPYGYQPAPAPQQYPPAQPYAAPAQSYAQPQPYPDAQSYPEYPPVSAYTPATGQNMMPYQVGTQGDKSKLAAGLLGIFLGALGIHNFYLGRTSRGLVQLLMTVLSLGILSVASGIWGLVEGILILASSPGSQWHKDGMGRELTD